MSSRSIEGATGLIVATLALAAAKPALANTVSVVDPSTAVAQLVNEAETEHMHPGVSNNTAHYSQTLPGNERASITVVSGEAVAGQPDPNSVTYLGVSVSSTKYHKLPHGILPAPIMAVSLNQSSGGTWTSHSETGIWHGRNAGTTSINLAELSQASTEEFNATSLVGGIDQIDFTEPQEPDAAGANRLLGALLAGAQELIYQIRHNQEIPRQ
ncbi:MAG TPA: hypothetical protein VFC50_01255 [Candidatus Dormibacteraeota bacterium]|nr:hypothetical protein [Candidatus Dormibacteraeota bacterium]